MKKMLKKVLGLMLAVAVCVTVLQPMEAYALETSDTTVEAGPWKVSEGVTARVENGILYIEGEGAVPDYAADALGTRPWRGSVFQGIWVSEGITEIGSYAFASLGGVHFVNIPSTTFVKDATSFAGISSKCSIRIMGKKYETKMIGNIPYTSAMSIVSWIQDNPDYTVHVDFDSEAKSLFKTMTYPYLTNVFYSVENVPFERRSYYYDGEFIYSTTPICRWIGGQSKGYSLKCTKSALGYYTYLHLSNFMGEYEWGTGYEMKVVGPAAKNVETTPGECIYQLDIPTDLVKSGRTFKLLCITSNKTGEVVTFDDLDVSDTTFTFQTAKVGTTYALVYKDPVVEVPVLVS